MVEAKHGFEFASLHPAGQLPFKPGCKGVRRIRLLRVDIEPREGDTLALAPHTSDPFPSLREENPADAQIACRVDEIIRAAQGNAESQVHHGA